MTPETPALAAHDTLLILAPPIALVEYLDRLWAAKRAKGEQPPEQWIRWLDRWKAIRADGASEIDYVTADEYAALGEMVIE